MTVRTSRRSLQTDEQRQQTAADLLVALEIATDILEHAEVLANALTKATGWLAPRPDWAEGIATAAATASRARGMLRSGGLS